MRNDMPPLDLRDPATFARLYDAHARGVHAAAARVLGDPVRAQDVVQDVFLRLWRRPDRFDPRRGEIGTFLRLMARSRALDLWREGEAAGRASDRLRDAVATAAPRADGRPDAEVPARRDRALVHAALRRLPAPQREALILAYWGGLSADQIARRAGVPLGTAKSRIRLALSRLRVELAAPLAA